MSVKVTVFVVLFAFAAGVLIGKTTLPARIIEVKGNDYLDTTHPKFMDRLKAVANMEGLVLVDQSEFEKIRVNQKREIEAFRHEQELAKVKLQLLKHEFWFQGYKAGYKAGVENEKKEITTD